MRIVFNLQLLFSAIVLLYPGLMLIDYGHFQYPLFLPSLQMVINQFY